MKIKKRHKESLTIRVGPNLRNSVQNVEPNFLYLVNVPLPPVFPAEFHFKKNRLNDHLSTMILCAPNEKQIKENLGLHRLSDNAKVEFGTITNDLG